MSEEFHEESTTPEYGNLAALAEDLIYRLPGCDDLMVRKTIRDVYRDFCKRTCVLRTKQNVEVVSGETDYAIHAVHPFCSIDTVTDVVLNGRKLDVEGYDFCGGDFLRLDGRFLPDEKEDPYTLEVTCIEIPNIGSEYATHHFINRYGDAIVSGVLMRLMAMSGKAWSDDAQAAMNARLYENALTENRVKYHAGGNLSAGELNFIKKGTIL